MAYGKANIDTIQSSTAGTPPQFNDGNGTQTGTLCRAWVNFNSSGILGSFNVSSVTRASTGNYTVNLTTAMPDTTFSMPMSARNASFGLICSPFPGGTLTTSAIQLLVFNYAYSAQDPTQASVAIFR